MQMARKRNNMPTSKLNYYESYKKNCQCKKAKLRNENDLDFENKESKLCIHMQNGQ